MRLLLFQDRIDSLVANIDDTTFESDAQREEQLEVIQSTVSRKKGSAVACTNLLITIYIILQLSTAEQAQVKSIRNSIDKLAKCVGQVDETALVLNQYLKLQSMIKMV